MSTTSGSRDYEAFDALAQEFADRYRRGERPSIEEYVARLPGLAAEIREMFPALVEMERAEGEARLASPPRPSAPAPSLSQVGDYRVLREVGRGGMGVVYEAEQVSLGRRVALKVLPHGVAGDRRSLERFRREARAAARLHHTNIVPVFEVGEDGGVVFYAMQFIQGQGLDLVIDELSRLRERSRQAPSGRREAPADAGADAAVDPEPPAGVETSRSSPLGRAAQSLLTGRFDAQGDSSLAATEAPSDADGPPSAPAPSVRGPASSAVLPGGAQLSSVESSGRRLPYFQSVAQIGRQAAQGLAYAHARGVVHRDVKPSNLLLDTAGVVWITDFGLAKADDDGLTQSGDILGTIRYMAPERFRGEADARADVYALGLTLYELLTLRPAFDGPDRLRLIERIKAVEPERPRAIDGRIPRDLETVVLKAVEKEPSRRYPSADAMAEDLRRFLADEPVKARRVSAAERYWRWARRNPTVAALGAVITALLVASAVAAGLAAGHFNRMARANREVAERERGARQGERNARERAEKLRAEAQAVSARLLAEEGRVRAGLYASRMNLLQVAWARDEPLRVRELLESARPAAGGPDLRGFEWRYWERRMRSEARIFRRGSNMGGITDLSRDGSRMLCRVYTSDPGYRVMRIQVIDTADGREHRESTIPGEDGMAQLVLSGAGSRLASCRFEATPDGGGRLHLRVWDVADGRERLALSVPSRSTSRYRHHLALDDRGDRLALGVVGPESQGGEVRVWDVGSGSELLRRTWEAPWAGTGMDLRGDGGAVAVTLSAPSLPSRGAVRLWGVDDGREVRAAPSTTPLVVARPLFVGDGSRLLFLWNQARSSDANPPSINLATLDAATGGPLISTETGLRSEPGSVVQAYDAVASADGRRIAVTSFYTPWIHVLDAEAGAVLFRICTGDALAKYMAFVRGSDALVVVNGAGAVREYDLDPKGPLAAEVRLHLPACRESAVSPDGRRIASFDGREVTVVDAATGAVVGRCPAPLPEQSWGRMVFSPDGARMAAWGVASAAKVPPAGIGASLVLEDGRHVVRLVVPGAAAARDGRLRVGDALLAVERDGRRVELKGMSLADAVAQVIGPAGTPVRIVVSPGGTGPEAVYEIKRAAVPGIIGATWPTLLLWDPKAGRVAKIVLEKTTVETEGVPPAFRPDGRCVALLASIPAAGADPARQRLQLRDAEDGRVLADGALPPGRYDAMAFAPGGKSVVLAGFDPERKPPGHLLVEYDPAASAVLRSVPVGAERIDRVVFSPDGGKLALLRPSREPDHRDVVVLDWPRGVEAWRASFAVNANAQILWIGPNGKDVVTFLTFSPDGRRLAVAWPGGLLRSQVRMWETETGAEVLAQPLGSWHGGVPGGLAFGASGDRLLIPLVEPPSPSPEARVQVLDAAPISPALRAADLLDEHSRDFPLPSERLERLLADSSLDPEVRDALPAVVATRIPVFSHLRTAAMQLALAPGKPAADYERALRYVEEALRLQPDDADSHGLLGALLFRLGRDDARAAAALERAARDDAYPIALPFLVALHARRGAKAEAAAAARRLAAWAPRLQDQNSTWLERTFEQFRREYLAHVQPVAAPRPTADVSTPERLSQLNQLVEKAGPRTRPQILTERAALRARSRDWVGALADCDEAARLDPAKGHWPLYRAGALRAYLGDRAGLAATVRRMRLDAAGASERELRDRVLKLSLLVPPIAPAPEELLLAVESAAERGVGELYAPWSWTTLALADVRADRPARALERLRRARDPRGPAGPRSLRALAASVEALALDALGRRETARQALDRARSLFDGPSGGQDLVASLGVDWHDWLIARVVYREAMARIVYDPEFPADPFAR